MKDLYAIVRRIDWIRQQLDAGGPINSTIIMAEFAVCIRTAHRDIKYVKAHYGQGRKALVYDYRDRAFYLE